MTTTSRPSDTTPQGGLFDEPQAFARRTDPPTGKEAARRMRESGQVTAQEAIVLDALDNAGAHGLTTWEFGDQNPELERESFSSRFTHLRRKGLIAVTGKRGRPGEPKSAPSMIHVLKKFAPEEDDEPKPNSPEDLGQVPPSKSFGTPRPEPDPIPENFARSAIQHDDAKKFVAWVYQQDIEIHAEVTFGHVVVAFSGFSPKGLGWLCQAIREVGKAPAPSIMRQALLKKDVSILRDAEI